MAKLLISAALFGLLACGGALGRAETAFSEGRYPDAKQTLLALEADSATWPDAKRAEYALYRGLTHSALGDRDQAAVWLREARAIESTHPKSLSFDNLQRLKLAENGLASN